MGIFRAGIYSAVSTGAKLVTGLVIIKLVAAYAGPEGVGKFGQFLSLMALTVVFAGGGIGSGITKYVSEYRDAPEIRRRLLETAMAFTLVAATLIGLAFLILHKYLALQILGDERLYALIIFVALAMPVIGVHTFILAVINGFMDVRRVAIINVAASCLGLFFAAVLSYYFQLNGALYAVLVGQALLLFVSYPVFRKSPWFDRVIFKPKFEWLNFQRLAKYSLMSLTSAMISPVVQIWVRNHLADEFSWQGAGYWQAISKVSEAYLLCITTVISIYYLPALSALTTKKEILRELKNGYVIIMPLVVFMAIAIFILREPITIMLFSREFLGGQFLFGPQLVGDVLRIASFLLSYLMLAKAMTKLFIASEVVFSLTYVALVYLCTKKFGLVGVCYAFIANYFLYFLFNICVAGRYIKRIE